MKSLSITFAAGALALALVTPAFSGLIEFQGMTW
jgi:hypothetical protein